MCAVCDFNKKLVPAQKEHPALDTDGNRTVWGYYQQADAAIISQFYPNVGAELVQKIANCINHPRLLEVMGVVEMAERFMEKSFSKIRDLTIDIAANPLSVLYWSEKKGVRRIKTLETEMLHGPMEKLSLRRKGVELVNKLLREHGFELTFACSCCVIAVAPKDMEALYASEYYDKREGFGREFDSDVLTVSGALHGGVSVSEIPPEILACTADFGPSEVASYLRFAGAAQAVIRENVVRPDFSKSTAHVRSFLVGK